MPDPTSEGSVLSTEVTDRIGIITMQRPERRNALNGELMEALDKAVKAFADDPEVKVVVLTGAPAPGAQGGFCSGGDIKGGGHGTPGAALGVPPDALSGDLSRHERHTSMLLHLMAKPTIAMVGGPAVGAGCSLAAACDLRFASEDAVFMTGFSPNGLSGDYGGSVFWTRIVGTARARQLYFLNEKITATQALEYGMVHAVLAPDELRQYTLGVAARLVRISAALLRLIKSNLNEAEDEPARRRYLFALEAENQAHASSAMAERLRSRQAGEAPSN